MNHCDIDLILSDRIKCSREDKLKCVETILLIEEAARTARHRGIFALKDFALKETKNEFLKLALNMLFDPYSDEEIWEILGYNIMGYGYEGWKLLEQLIIRDGIIQVGKSKHPQGIRYILCFYFGEDYDFMYEEVYKRRRKGSDVPKYEKKIKHYKTPMTISLHSLDFISIGYLDDNDMQTFLSCVSLNELAVASSCASKALVNAVIRNLPNDEAEQFERKCKQRGLVSNYDITFLRRALEFGMQKLVEDGDKTPNFNYERLPAGVNYEFDFMSIAFLDDDSIKTIISKTLFKDLVHACQGAYDILIDAIVRNLPEDKANEIIEMNETAYLDTEITENARERIESIVFELGKDGLITMF